MVTVININPYSFAGCTDSAPTGVYMKDASGGSNHITLLGITSGGPSQFHIANGETLSIGSSGIAEPMLQVIATSEHTGGDAPTAWEWTGVLSGGSGASVEAENPIDFEDLDGNQITIMVEDPTRNPQITIGLTASNCDGSNAASDLTFTVTA